MAAPHRGFLLFPEQRTGKCLVSLALADRWKPSHIFVACPKNAIPVWEKEIKKHLVRDWGCIIEITNFERILASRKTFYRRSFPSDALIIMDEGHRIKGRRKIRMAMRTLAQRFCRRLVLTGTPVAQGSYDTWALFDFIDKSLLGSWGNYRGNFCIMGGFKGKKIVGYKNKEEFQRILGQYSYRITLNEARAEAGKKPIGIHRVKVIVQLSEATRKIYSELEDTLCATVQGYKVKTSLVITQAMRLHQLCGGFISSPDGGQLSVGSEKLDRLSNLLAVRLAGQKAVICCRFTWEINAIRKMVKAMGLKTSIISGKHKFTGEEEHRGSDIVLLQIQSGVAIDLAFAPNMIFYSWNYSFIDNEQSRFRIIEFDSDQVNYFYLIAKDTVDEIIYEAVVRKKKFAGLVIDHYRRAAHDRS